MPTAEFGYGDTVRDAVGTVKVSTPFGKAAPGPDIFRDITTTLRDIAAPKA